MTTSPSKFGNSWSIRGVRNCPEVGEIGNQCLNADAQSNARRHCGIIRSSMFRDCGRVVPVLPWFDRCVNDYCGSSGADRTELICSTLQAFASDCSTHGVTVEWRSQSLCREYLFHLIYLIPITLSFI